jgi:hypothetical protein
MIAALLLLAAQPALPAQAEPAAENDIVVIGQRVRKIKFRIKLDKRGQVACRITRSSGDPEIDGFACDAARPCVRPDIVTKAAMEACLAPRWTQLPAQIAVRRRARSESGHAPN